MRLLYIINCLASFLAASYAFTAIDKAYPLNVNLYIGIAGAFFTFNYGYCLIKSTSRR
jgi:hypothetical protein